MILLMRNYVASVKGKSIVEIDRLPWCRRSIEWPLQRGWRILEGWLDRSKGSCSRKEDGEELLRITRDFCSYSWCIARCFFWNHPILFFVRLFSFPRKIEFENSSCSVLGQLPERQLRFKEEDRGMKNLLESPIFYDWIFQVDFLPDLIPNSKFYEERDVGALWNILIKKTFS